MEKLLVESGGEYLIPFARKKMRQLKDQTHAAHLSAGSRVFDVGSERIRISTMAAGRDTFDFVRITAGGGDLFMRIGQSSYALVKWDGSSHRAFSSVGKPYDGFNVAACTGTTLVLNGFDLALNSPAFYTVSATTFDVINGPIAMSTFGEVSNITLLSWLEAFAFIADPPPWFPQKLGTADLALAVTSNGAPVSLTNTGEEGYKSVFAGDGGIFYDESSTFYDTAAALFWLVDVSGAITQRAYSSALPTHKNLSGQPVQGGLCANSTIIIRPVTHGASSHNGLEVGNSIEISDFNGTAQSTIAFLPTDITTWLNFACDDTQFVAMAIGVHPTLGLGLVVKHYTLPGLVETDLTSRYRAMFPGFGSATNGASRVVVVNGA